MKEGWKVRKLGDVIEIRNGKNQQLVLSPTGEYPIYGSAANLMGYATDYICLEGTTIIGRKGNISTPIFIDHKFWNVDTAFGLYPKEGLNNKMLYYFCLGFDFEKLNRGTTIPSLVKTELLNIPISFPTDIGVQHRIVTLLDQAYAAIDQAKANIQRNLQNAKELFQSELNSIFENRGEGWVERKLGEVYDVRDGTHDSPKYLPVGYPLITSKNLKNDFLTFDNVNYISENDYININKRSKVDKGDILFAMIGTIGNPVVIIDEPTFAIKNVALFKVPDCQSSHFLKYFLDSKKVIDKMNSEAKGTTQKFVGLGYLRDFNMQLPSLSEQLKIVNQLDTLSVETKRIETLYQQKLNTLEELKKSILHKAFNGELN